MKKRTVLRIAALTFFMCFGMGMSARADSYINDSGEIVYSPTYGEDHASKNALEINELISSDEEKTVVFENGSTIYIGATLRVGSNTTIKAGNATIIQIVDGRGILSQNVDGTGDYDSIENVSITGGIWKNKENKATHSIFRFCHGKNMKISKAKITTNFKSHGIELIAMKNVTVDKCTIKAVGEKSSTSVEDAVQIDVATQKTAPGVYSENSDARLFKGQTCSNITVKGCTISASRGVCANYTQDAIDKFHSNIKIKNNKITAESAEAVALFNTFNANVCKNTLVTNSGRLDEAYSVGLNIIMMGKPSKAVSKATVTAKNNTIKGGRQALNIVTKTGTPYGGKVIITGNRLYCKSGKDVALHVEKQAVTESKYTASNNKLYSW